MLLVEAGDDYAADAAVVNIVRTRKSAAAVDRHTMAAVGEARADLLGKALEAAVPIGNAASSDDSDVHEEATSN
jgi:hypothetical protein